MRKELKEKKNERTVEKMRATKCGGMGSGQTGEEQWRTVRIRDVVIGKGLLGARGGEEITKDRSMEE